MSAELIHPSRTGGTDFDRRSGVVAVLAVLAGAALAGAAVGRAQLSPLGEEFQVNTYTTSYQRRPAVSAASAGSFVVVWQSYGSSGTDTSAYSVQGQRYAADGAALGGQLQANTFTTSDQSFPAVAAASDGDFVVVWLSYGSGGTDTSGTSIQARRYAANGVPLSGQAQVNTYTTSDQWFPAVAAGSAGNFVVAWQSLGSSGTDADGWSIQAQRYAANGAALGGQFQVNSYTTNAQVYPAVATDSAGNFVVVWQSLGSNGTDTSLESIQARRYAADGAALGGQFQVNSRTTNYQKEPAVAADGAGNFVVVWHSFGSSGTDTSAASIQAQRYDAGGAAQGGQFQVNTYTSNAQRYPAVAADSAATFVVTWQSYGSSASDTSLWSIQARRYAANGVPLAGESQVNSFSTNGQQFPAVALASEGDFVVAWQSPGSYGTDTSQVSIQAQRYGCVFCDGFESGDTDPWSAP